MTITQLRYFLAICQYGKISAASEQLHVSGPTLSVAMKQLEDELELKLVLRIKSQLSLTADGERLREKATDVVERFDRLKEEMSQPAGEYPVVRFGAPSTLGEYLCGPIVRAFTARYPSALFEMPSMSSDECARQVAAGNLELAVCDQRAVTGEDLEFLPIADCAVCGYVRQEHPLAGKTGVSAQMLKDEDLFLVNKRSIFARELSLWFQSGGVRPNMFQYSQREILDLTVSMVERHNAVVFLLDRVFQSSLPESIASFTLDPPLRFRTGMIRRRNAQLSGGTRLFWEFCREYDGI
ncbi:MAG: LysR family transcriptional regulator [Oscillospiraceae bacterium]|nr:LysR family transcriptional regulator [Oscillospiraceae bacterium]